MSIGELHDHPRSWPDGSSLAAFTYSLPVSGDLEQTTRAPAARISWLDRADYASSAYRHLADQYRRHGFMNAADQVLIATRRRRREWLPWWRKPFDRLF